MALMVTQLSLTSDYFQSFGDPQQYLKRIAEAGFTHIHWCHEWSTDRIYTDEEVCQIQRWFKEYGLKLLNLHGSHGKERFWVSLDEDQRKAGIELVQNRVQMTARLGGEVIIMHIPTTAPPEKRPALLVQIRKSLDEIAPFVKERGIRMALENMIGEDFEMLEMLIPDYDPGFLGFCYDSGHGNMGGKGMLGLEGLKDRLIAIHLHDNDGMGDQHKIPFTGTVDWEALMRMIASSAYGECINLEVLIRDTGLQDEQEFLRQTYQAGERLASMLEKT
jgi:sugar phosphate isomerase/epimerase